MMTQRANEALHRTQSELSVEQEAKSNQERACQTLTRRIVELEVRLLVIRNFSWRLSFRNNKDVYF